MIVNIKLSPFENKKHKSEVESSIKKLSKLEGLKEIKIMSSYLSIEFIPEILKLESFIKVLIDLNFPINEG